MNIIKCLNEFEIACVNEWRDIPSHNQINKFKRNKQINILLYKYLERNYIDR